MKSTTSTESKQRIAYFCHIDWNWIKQRPQFIAEELLTYYIVDFYQFESIGLDTHLRTSKTAGKTLQQFNLYKLPLSGRLSTIKALQQVINGLLFRQKSYDLVWICSPEVLLRIDITQFKQPIVYDCMDDMIESHDVPHIKSELLNLEQQLLNKCRYCFVSSDSLKGKMIERGAAEEKIVTVYNGTNLKSLFASTSKIASFSDKTRFIITYFGTISKWIDIDILMQILHDPDLSCVEIKLIGPTDVIMPVHERLNYVGTVAHCELAHMVADNDLFILPFKLNSITISVDPVKFYEYIAFHGNIVSIYYPELNRYSNYVQFYNNYAELKKIILKLIHSNELSYSMADADAFVASSTWDERVKNIRNYLNKIL